MTNAVPRLKYGPYGNSRRFPMISMYTASASPKNGATKNATVAAPAPTIAPTPNIRSTSPMPIASRPNAIEPRIRVSHTTNAPNRPPPPRRPTLDHHHRRQHPQRQRRHQKDHFLRNLPPHVLRRYPLHRPLR